ncbi:hypothetical protein NDA13_005232 [Ustilago tritici]|nr:hypothetical protein NDA13_005232 [Ustilago tritici]
MMSELSFDTSALDATPPAKSRRISIPAIAHADLSNPTPARPGFQLLELENVGLSEELAHTEEEIKRLEDENKSLRMQLSSSACSSCRGSVVAGEGEQKCSAEVKSARRLLHRLATLIAAQDPLTTPSEEGGVGEESKSFNLDQSLYLDPERSLISPTTLVLSTPNKTQVARNINSDLLDDVESVRSAWEESARKHSFVATEQKIALQNLTTTNEHLASQLSKKDSEWQAKLQAKEKQLSTVQEKLDQTEFEQHLTQQAAAKKSQARIEGLELQIQGMQAQSKPDEHVLQLQAQLTEANKQIESLQATPIPLPTWTVDDAEMQALRSQVTQSAERVGELEAQLDSTRSELSSARRQVEESGARVATLEVRLEQRDAKAADLQSIFAELQAKKDRLHSIQMHTSQISGLEQVVVQQERIVDLVNRSTQLAGEVGVECKVYAQEMGVSLAMLKSGMVVEKEVQKEVQRVDASTSTDAIMVDESEKEEKDEEKEALIKELEESEARVLRRNEQIGSLQRQLKNVEMDLARTRTNRMLAEETVADLDDERSEHLSLIKKLEGQIASSQSSAPTHTQVLETQTTEQEERVAELQSALTAAGSRIADLTSELETLQASHTALQSQKSQLESQISTLTSQVQKLESTLSTTTTQTAEAESELTMLSTNLRKAQERLSSTTSQLDSVQLALAEQRESSSLDSDRIECLETQLSALKSEHDALLVSSVADKATCSELNFQIGAIQTELRTSTAKLAELQAEQKSKSGVEAELEELKSKHAELEKASAERDAAIAARNTEYWNLKEELAELQDQAERSLPSPVITPQALAELQSRLTWQENALLKLKSDLSAARSTEELLNEQYSAAQKRVRDLEDSLATQSPAEDTGAKEMLKAMEEEIKYLEERVGQLEEELGRKAEEVEEADSKILDALKESKKFATRYSKLSGKYEVLQKEKKQEELKRVEVEGQLARAKLQAKSQVHGVEVVRSNSRSTLAGRKRAKPDSVEQDEGREAQEAAITPSRTATGGVRVKAVFAPSPNAANSGRTPSSFTPIRRTALSKSGSRSTTKHTPIVIATGLGLGTPCTTNINTSATQEEGGMVRSTSNPSELIAARLLHSPGKPLLSDKTNTAKNSGSGTSRLSSKPATVGGQVLVKPVTTLLPSEGERERRKEKEAGERKKISMPVLASAGAAGGAGGAGAADFLAKMKAQRAART